MINISDTSQEIQHNIGKMFLQPEKLICMPGSQQDKRQNKHDTKQEDKERNRIESRVQSRFGRMSLSAVDNIHPIGPASETATANAMGMCRILTPIAAFTEPIFFVLPVTLSAEIPETPSVSGIVHRRVHHPNKRLLQSCHGHVLLVLVRKKV